MSVCSMLRSLFVGGWRTPSIRNWQAKCHRIASLTSRQACSNRYHWYHLYTTSILRTLQTGKASLSTGGASTSALEALYYLIAVRQVRWLKSAS
jgi:hypothetical protein